MKMMLNEYQNAAAETAVYPGRLGILNEGTDLTGVYYTALGLSGESGELLEKILWATGFVSDDILKEMGDQLWYISQCAMELGCPLSFIYENHHGKYTALETQLEVCAYIAGKSGAYCDCVKKCLRDNHGVISSKIKAQLVEHLSMMLLGQMEMCSNYNIPMSRVMEMNIAKLSSRKLRGMLGGNGDNR